MKKSLAVIRLERVKQTIVRIRDEKVILDADLAKLYGVSTKRLNEQVKRNRERFPEDFMFQLTIEEARSTQRLRSQFATLKRGQHLKYRPLAFTEHGAIMAANILNSKRAVRVSVQIVRAFIRLRQILASNEGLARKLNDLEKKYDRQFKIVFDAIRELMTPPPSGIKPIGFRPKRQVTR
jgi:phage regulator Rha-like protein